MNEDVELAAIVKSALEDDVSLKDDQLQALLEAAAHETKSRLVRRLLWRWSAPALLAASIALSLVIRATFSEVAASDVAKNDVTDAICLLCELDGVMADDRSSSSPGELLLAWQEAPCADLL